MTSSEFLSLHGINETILYDQKIHRFKLNDSNSKSGWYIAFDLSGNQTIVAGDFKSGEKWQWNSNAKDKNNPEIKKLIKQAQKDVAREKLFKQKEAEKQASALLRASVQIEPKKIPYLVKKQLPYLFGAQYVKTDSVEFLAVPIQNSSGNITSLQKIFSDGNKRFLPGGKIKGCFHAIGELTDTIYITEGFATGASVHMATDCMTVCAFYAGNLEPVFKEIKNMHPKARVILAADNDAFKDKNTGLDYAQKLNQKYGLEYHFPTFKNVLSEPTDFNDLHRLEGLETVGSSFLNQIVIGDDAIEALTTVNKADLVLLWENIGISVTRQGLPIINEANIQKVIEYDTDLNQNICFDTFQNKIMIKLPGDKKNSQLCELHISTILIMFQTKYGLSKLSLAMCRAAVEHYAYSNERNECQEYITGIEWDGVERIRGFFCNYCGTPDSDYTSDVSHNWWVSMVARIMEPGCKVDNMVVLEGAQGNKKSSMLSAVGGKWYCENTADIGQKDFYQNMEGTLLIEIAELDSFSKAGVNTIKRVLSSRVDKYRPSYGRYTINVPRQCVFAGTTNEKEYLKDDTGARRFWPIKCKEINLEKVTEDRDQLFAEALVLFRLGAQWYHVPKIAEQIQENRRDVDPWEKIVVNWATDRNPFTTFDCLKDCLEIDAGKQDKRSSNRIGKILRNNGFKSKLISDFNQPKQFRAWVIETE